MIITLKGADFSSSNIGTLSTWTVSRVLGAGATYSGATLVDKGAALNATVTIADGYEIGSAGVTVTMGGVGQAYTISGNVITINIAEVTGNVIIKVPTKNTNIDTEETLDSATLAFVNAAAITDETMRYKINTLVTSLKTNNLWDKLDALYPCVGSTFTQMSYNLKDPNQYQLRITQIGTTAQAPVVTRDIGFTCGDRVESDTMSTEPGSDFHLMCYSGQAYSGSGLLALLPANGTGNSSDKISGCCIYAQNESNNTSKQDIIFRTGSKENAYVIDMEAGIGDITKVGDMSGLFIGSLTTGLSYNGQIVPMQKNGNPALSKFHTRKTFFYNGFGSESDTATKVTSTLNGGHPVRLAGFGKGLSEAEMQTYSNILNAFKNIY